MKITTKNKTNHNLKIIFYVFYLKVNNAKNTKIFYVV